MIEKHYPSKRVKTVYQQSTYGYQQHNGSVFTMTAKAAALGISVVEYQDRIRICAQAVAKNGWRVGDVGYPCTIEGMTKYGKCKVVGLVTHYDQYGTVEWNDPPFIMSVMPIDGDDNATVQCSVGWLVITNPMVTIENEC